MKPLEMRAFILVFLAIVAGVSSGPISFDDNTCATQCSESSKFQYEAGKTYRFTYEADTVTSLQGASEEQSGLFIRAKADISVTGPCEHSLRLSDVALLESDPRDLSKRSISENSRDFARALEENALRYAFNDGAIESVCASTTEPVWVLNIKRGVLSTLQNSMDQLDRDHTVTETDVAGDCEAVYTANTQGWNTYSISKSKNLLGCTSRNGHFTAIQATPYKIASDVQSLPLMKSEHNCEQKVSQAGLLMSSEIKENHVFRPFSNQDSGAQTTIRQLLQYENEVRHNPGYSGPSTRRTSLLFEHPNRNVGDRDDETQLLDKLREICNIDDIRPNSAKAFGELVYNMRNIDTQTLRRVHSAVKSNRVCQDNHETAKKFFHDAIPATNTIASVALIKEMIESGEVDEVEAEILLTSLAFISEPKSEMIRELKSLLAVAEPLPKAYLSVSTLLHSYCRSADCGNERDVVDIINMLTQKLEYNCKADSQNVLMALKAIGNAGQINDLSTLGRCFRNDDISTEVRVAAIRAARRINCDVNRNEMLTVFKNTAEDSEIRIEAYLGAMQCPDSAVISDIKMALESEEVNQVGSFVWTHLTNLMETSDVFKQDIRQILEDGELKKEFNLDNRKFSKNYEASMFFDSLNAGGKAESNLIWNPNSYLPRSGMMNLTVDMFGHSVNLFEVGGRAEGMERYVEKYFGPGGVFEKSPLGESLGRSKRSMDNQFERYDRKLTEATQSDPSASAYLKIFGNELRYYNLKDFTGANTDFNILEFLIKLAQEHEIDLSKSLSFLDSEITIPTSLGLPLKLSVNGTATVGVKVGGKMDLRRAATAPSSFVIDGYVKPSGAVEFSTLLGVDATMARTGLKMVATLHSSTEVDGHVELQESQVMTAKFNMPKDKIEILNVETNFYIVHQDKERRQEMIKEGRVELEQCSGNMLKKTLGLKVCGDISFPSFKAEANSPHFLFRGPMSASISMQRADTHNSYELEARLQTIKERKNGNMEYTHIARFAIDTPGSQVDRKILTEFVLNRGEKTMNAQLVSPWKQATLDGALVNSAEMKSASLKFVVDKNTEYSVLSQLEIDEKSKSTIYTPRVEIVIPGMKMMTLKGNTKYIPGEKVDTDISLNNVFRAPVTFKGSVDINENKKGTQYKTNCDFASPIFNTNVNGFTNVKDGVIATRLEFKYDRNTKEQHRFVFNGKVKDGSNQKSFNYAINTALQTTEFPDYNMEFDADILASARHAESSITFQYGDNPKDTKKKITFKSETNYDGTIMQMKMDHTMKLMYKAANINMQAKIDHKHDINDLVKTHATVSYRPGKNVELDVLLTKESTSPIKMNGDITLSYPGRVMRLYESVEQKAENAYTHELIVQWQKGQQVRTSAEYSRDPASQQHHATAEITMPSGATSSLSGDVVLVIDNFSAKVAVDHQRQMYTSAVDYNFKLYGGDLKGAAHFDMAIPTRHVTAETTVSSVSGDYNVNSKVMWDADNDKSQKLIIDGGMSLSAATQSGRVKVIFPSRKVTMNFNQEITGTNYLGHIETSWASDKSIVLDVTGSLDQRRSTNNMSGNLKLRCPCPLLKNIEINLNHKNSNDMLDTVFDITYADGKTIRLDSKHNLINGFMGTDNKVIVNTPFYGYEQMDAALKYDLSQNTFNGNMETKLNEQAIRVIVAAQKDGTNAESSVEITTPFRNAELMAVRASGSNTGRQVSGHFETQWSDEKMEFDMAGTNNGNGYRRSVEGEASIKVAGKEFVISGKHEDDGRTFVSTSTTQWAKNKAVTVSFDMAHDTSSKTNRGTISLDSPFTIAKRASIGWNVNVDVANGKLNMEYDGKWNRKNGKVAANLVYSESNVDVALSYDGNTRSLENAALKLQYAISSNVHEGMFLLSHNNERDIQVDINLTNKNDKVLNGNMRLQTRFEGVEDISTTASIVNKVSEKSSRAEFKWADNKMITIDAETSNFNPFQAKGAIRLTTPFAGAERFVADFDNSIDNELYSTKSGFEYGATKRYEVSTGYKVNRNDIVLSFGMTTPCEAIKSVQVSISHSGYGTNFDNVVGFTLDADAADIAFNSQFNMRGFAYLVGEVALNTPYEYLRNPKITLSHKLDQSEYVSTLSTEFYPNNKIVIGSRFRNDRVLKSEVTLETSFYEVPSVSVGLEHTSTRGNIFVDSQIMRKPVKFTSAYTFRGAEEISAEGTLTTPFSGFEILKASMMHTLNEKVSTQSLNINYKRSAFDFKNEVSFENGYAVTTNIKTPFDVVRGLHYELTHNRRGLRINNAAELSVDTNSGNFKLNHNVRMNGAMFVFADAQLSTPFREARQIAVKINHSLKGTTWVSGAEIVYPGSKIELDSKVTPETLEADIALKTPVKDIHFTSTKTKESGNTVSIISFTYGEGKTMALETRYDMRRGFFLSSRLTTPCTYVENVFLQIDHTGSMENFNNQIKFTHNLLNGPLEGSTSFSWNGYKLNAAGKVETPFRGFESTEMKLENVLKSVRAVNTDVTLRYGRGQAIVLSNKFDFSSLAKMNGEFTMATPFRNARTIQVAFSHSGRMPSFTNQVELTINREKHMFTGEYTIALPFATKLHLESDALSEKTVDATITSGISNDEITSDLLISYGRNEIVKYASTVAVSNGVDAHVELNTAYTKPFTLDINHKGSIPAVQHQSTMTYGRKSFVVKASLKNIDVEFELTTPYDMCRVLTLNTKSQGTKYVVSFAHNDMTNAELTGDITGKFVSSVVINSPYEVFRMFNLNINVEGNQFYTKMVHNDVNNAEVSFMYNGDVSLTVKSSLNEDIQVIVSHNGDFPYFSSKAMVQYGRGKKIGGEVDTTTPMTGRVHMYSPCQYFQDMDISYSHKAEANEVSDNARLSFNGKEILNLDSSFNVDRDINGVIKVETAFDSIKTAKVKVSHKLTRRLADSNIVIMLNGDKVKADTKITFYPSVDAKISFSTPFKALKDVSVSVKHDGDYTNFNSDVELSYNGNSIEYNGKFELIPLEGSFQLKTPFKYAENMAIFFKHTGTKKSFTNNVAVSHNLMGTISYTGEFSMQPSVTGKFTLNTPFMDMKATELSFDVTSNSVSAKFATDVTGPVTYDSSLTTSPAIEGQWKLTTTSYMARELIFSVRHEGSALDFKQNVDLSLNGEEFKYGLIFTLNPTTNIQLNINTPYENVEAILNHNQSPRGFVNTVEINTGSYGNVKYAGDLKWYPKVDGTFTFQSPIPYARDISIAFNHKGSASRFNNHIDINTDSFGRINYEGSFNTSPITGNFELSVPTPWVRDIKFNFNHEGSRPSFQSMASLTYDRNEISALAEVKSFSTFESRFQVKTPFRSWEDYSLIVTKSGNNGRAMILRYDNPLMKSTVQIESMTKFNAEFWVSDIVTFNEYAITLSQEGSSNTFEITSNQKRVGHSDAKLELSPFNLDIKVTSQWDVLRDLSVSASTASSSSQYNGNLAVVYNGKSVVNTNGDLKIFPHIEGSFVMSTCCKQLEKVNIKLLHSGELQAFDSELTIEFNNENMNGKVHFNLAEMEGTIDVNTPITGEHQVKASAGFTGNANKFTASAKFGVNDDLIKAAVDFDARPLEIKTSLSTPFEMIKSASFALRNRVSRKLVRSGIDMTYDGEKIVELDLNVKNYDRVVGTFELKSPFIEYFEISVKHQVEGSSVASNAEVKYAKGKTINVQLNANTQNGLESELVLNTPFSAVQYVKGQVTYNFIEGNTNVLALVTVNRDTYSVGAEGMSVTGNTRGSVFINTPNRGYENFVLALDHSVKSEMNTKVELSSSEKTLATAIIRLATRGGIAFSVAITNPYIEDMSLSITQEGAFPNQINVLGEAKYGNMVNTAKFDFSKSSRSIDASLDLTCPKGTTRFEVHHAGDLNEAKSSMAVAYGSQRVAVESSFSSSNGIPSAFLVSLKTPFRNAELITLDFNNVLRNGQYRSSVSFSWAPRQTIVVSSNGKYRGSLVQLVFNGDIKITTPFESFQSLEISTDHQHSSSAVNTNWKINYNGLTVLDTSASYNHMENAEFTLRSPYPMSTSLARNGNTGVFNLNWDSTNRDSNIQVEFTNNDEGNKREISLKTITSSRTMICATTLYNTGNKLQLTTEFAWDVDADKKVSYSLNWNNSERRYQTIYDLTTRLDTPLRSIEVSLNHNDDKVTYTSKAALKWDAAKDSSKVITAKNVFVKRDGQYSEELTLKHPALRKDIVLGGDLALNGEGFVFSVNTGLDNSEKLTVSSSLTEVANGNYTLQIGISHPPSTLDVELVSHAAMTSSGMSAGLTMSYTDSRRAQQNVQIMGEIDAIKRQLNAFVATPSQRFDASGELTDSTLSGSLSSGNKRVSANVEYDEESFKAKVFYSPENTRNVLSVNAKYAALNDMALEAVLTHEGKSIEAINMEVDMVNNHLLHSRMYWRPTMFNEIASAAKSINGLSVDCKTSCDDITAYIRDEAMAKMQYLSTPSFERLVEFSEQEFQSFQADSEVIARGIRRMYYRNEFFLRDIARLNDQIAAFIVENFAGVIEAIDDLIADMNSYMRLVQLRYRQYLDIYSAKIEAAFGELKMKMDQAAAVVVAKYDAVKQQVDAKVAEWKAIAYAKAQVALEVATIKGSELLAEALVVIEPYAEQAMEFYSKAYDWYTSKKIVVAAKLSDLKAKLMPYYQRAVTKIMEIHEYLMTKFAVYREVISFARTQIESIDFLQNVRDAHISVKDKLTTMTKEMNDNLHTFVHKFNQVYRRASAAIADKAELLMEQATNERAKQFLTEVYKQAKFAYEYLNVEKNIKEAVTTVTHTTGRLIKKNAFYLANKYLNIEEDRLLNWNPKDGEIEFQLWLPFGMPEFQTVAMPNFDINGWMEDAKDLALKYYPSDFSTDDYYYAYKPSDDMSNWIPPFKASAYLSGSQNYMTFDKKSYEFAGSCSYTLARDFVNGKFTVLANYGSTDGIATRDSITFVSDNSEIVIPNNGPITVNGKQTELPFTAGSTTVTRTADKIMITNLYGVTVDIDVAAELVTVNIAGWFHGKVAGLLGTYTNEHTDDFRASNGRIVDDVETFARSWEVSSCRNHGNAAVSFDVEENDEHKMICKDLFFSKESPFRPCFRQVDPVPFLKKCIIERKMSGSVCKVAYFYEAICNKRGVPLKKLPFCDVEIEDGTNSADTVFVVEQKSCNQDAAAKLNSLGTNINVALLNKNKKNSRLALIGFGGEDIHAEPHYHTLSGKIYGGARDFESAVASLTFDNAGEDNDVFSALKMAASYPFRTGAAKSIVLLACSSCSATSIDYQDMADMLAEQGITLHVLTSHDFALNGDIKTVKTNYLFGIDKSTAYTSRHVSDKSLKGDQELFQMISQPTDMCASLAQATDGSFFNVDRLTTGRVRFQKHFMDIFGRRVAKNTADESKTLLGHPDEEPKQYYKQELKYEETNN